MTVFYRESCDVFSSTVQYEFSSILFLTDYIDCVHVPVVSIYVLEINKVYVNLFLLCWEIKEK